MNTVLSPLGQRVATGIIGVAFIPFQFFFGRYKSACAAADEYPTDEFGSSDCPALGQWTMHPLKFIVLVFVGLSDCPPLSCMAFQPPCICTLHTAPYALSATTGWLVPAPAHAPASRWPIAHVVMYPPFQEPSALSPLQPTPQPCPEACHDGPRALSPCLTHTLSPAAGLLLTTPSLVAAPRHVRNHATSCGATTKKIEATRATREGRHTMSEE